MFTHIVKVSFNIVDENGQSVLTEKGEGLEVKERWCLICKIVIVLYIS